jgi:hypothetical protein
MSGAVVVVVPAPVLAVDLLERSATKKQWEMWEACFVRAESPELGVVCPRHLDAAVEW